MQPILDLLYLTSRRVHHSCLCRLRLVWYKQSDLRISPGMPFVKHFVMRHRGSWCAMVVLVAIGSLTVSLATRYTSPTSCSVYAVRSCTRQAAPSVHRQRLAKDAACWIAPVILSTILPAPTSSPRIAPAAPIISSLLLAEALYNRPPPYI